MVSSHCWDEGKRLFRQIAEESARLVRKHKGSLSGEHGDGRLRGEFIPLMYGTEVYELMRQVKRTWDPCGVFNMNKIVDTPPMDEWLRFAVGQKDAIEEELRSHPWTISPKDATTTPRGRTNTALVGKTLQLQI